MIVSFNEIETMCYRAALGVGLTHGLAEDAAHIGQRLAVDRPDGLEIMHRALLSAETNPVTGPVFVREGRAWRAGGFRVPALVAGPVAADLRSADPRAEIVTTAVDEPAIMEICLSAAQGPAPAMEPLDVPERLWRDLGKLAARTYVPATDLSRLMGAGAGLSDND